MKTKNKKSKNPTTIYTVLGIIGDVLFFPIIIISLFSSVLMLFQKSKNYVPSFFGTSIVKILSESMVRDGFNVGDVVFVNKNNRDINVGDIVAFYYANKNLAETKQSDFLQVKYAKTDGDCTMYIDKITNEEKLISKSNTFDDEKTSDIRQKNRIYFHYVVGIYVEETTGNIYYKTCGAGKVDKEEYITEDGLAFGQSPETYYTREDLIVGKYSSTPIFIRKIMIFMGSSLGMILLVCLPICILIITESLSLIDQVSIIMTERRIMKGEIKIDDNDLKKSYNPNTMEPINKILYYFNSDPQDREKIQNAIWSEIFESETEKDIETSKHINLAIKNLENSDNIGYFNEMSETLSKRDKKKLEKETNSILMIKLFTN